MTRKAETIDDYLATRSVEVRPVLNDLRHFINATMPGTTEGMDYGVPVFLNAFGVPVIYLFGSKRHVNFGFLRSAELSDPDSLLKGSGTPTKHIRIVPGEPFDKDVLAEFIRQCSALEA